jgi:ornithine cyclodeaminase/alanine dehydrogenase-like protein (mu-crystallin family)
VNLLFLSEKETEAIGLSWPEAISTIEDLLRAHGLGRVVVPAKINVDTSISGQFKGLGNAMPSYIEDLKVYGIKWITWNFENPKVGLPGIFATIQINDPSTGAPLAILGGSWITAVRTGAVSAVICKYLASSNSRVLAIIGAGMQGKYQLEAIKEVLKISEVRIYDVREEAKVRYVKEMTEKTGVNIKAAKNVEEAVKDADVVVTVTTADEPLVKARWLKEKGTLVLSIGSYQEFDYPSIKRANKIVVDHLEQTLHRGELAKWIAKGMLSEKDIYGTIGDIVAGKIPGRADDGENIFCVPIGMGCDDLALAYKIWQKARSGNKGTTLPWI